MRSESTPADQRPFAAPCRQLPTRAAFEWIRAGAADYVASPRVSFVYGLLIFLLSLVVSLLAWKAGRYGLVMAMLSGFVFIAPLLATGMYSVSRQLERGERPSFSRSFRRMRMAIRDALIFALALTVIFLVWVRAAFMLHVFFPVGVEASLAAVLTFLAIGSAVGSIFAAVVFAVSAFSLPMIVDRDADTITACVTSVNAVLRNKPAMALWAACIVALTTLGFATAGLGLIAVIPLLGYATHHGYRQTIDASQWPASP